MTEPVTVKLKHPIARDSGAMVEEITLRRPKAGDLKGLSTFDVVRLDTNAICTLVGRISEPAFPPALFWQLEVNDLASISGAVVGFFADSESIPAT